MASKALKKKKGRSLDFTGVETGGKAVPDGNWLAEVVSVEEKEGSESGEPYLKWKWKVKEGPGKGGAVYDNTSLQPQALWKLRGLLESLGFDVPDGAMDFDESDAVGEEAILEIVNEQYNKKDQPRVVSYLSTEGAKAANKDDADDTDDDQEKDDDQADTKPTSKKKKGGSKIKVGSKVKFTDEDDNVITGVVTAIDGDDVTIEDKKGEEWEVEASELEIA